MNVYPRYLPKAQILFLLIVGALLLVVPLPFSVISPGPTTNLLNGPITVASSIAAPGTSSSGSSGSSGSSRSMGSILSLTVYVTTPGSHVTAPQLAAAWMRGDEMVIPEEVLYPGNEKASQAASQAKQEMDSSTKSAILAAANYLHRTISPSDVTVKLKDTGGPSAGLAFALALVTKVSSPQLFAGHVIAATGTITSAGVVGPIGGIDQKLIGAAHSKAEAVFIPVDNCADITRTPRGLRVIPVSNLAQAVAIMTSYSRLTYGASLTRGNSATGSLLPHC